MRQKLIGVCINLGMMPSGERKACQLGPAGGVTIKDVECYAFSHGQTKSLVCKIKPQMFVSE